MALSITCGNPPRGAVGTPYTHTFPVTGQGMSDVLVFAITAGSLPPGLTLNTSTGTVSGTPTHGGTYSFTITVSEVRGLIDSATLHVTTSLTGTALPAWAYTTGNIISANSVISPSRFLLAPMLANCSPPFPASYTYPITTNDIDVISGAAVTSYPELAFDPTSPNLGYPVDLMQAWRGLALNPGNLDFNIYDLTMDVHRVDGSTGTLIPIGYSVIYGGGVDASNPYNYIVNPGNAVDGDPATYATIHRQSIVGVYYPILEVGAAGWYDPGDSASVTCSITIVGPNNWLELWVWRQLFTVSAGSQTLVFPPGYQQALMLQLAAEFGRQFPGHDLRKVRAKLAAAIEHIDKSNVSNSQAIEQLPPPESSE